MNVYERLGRAVEALENEREQHLRTIALLTALKHGEYRLDQVTMTSDSSWSVEQEPVKFVVEEPDAEDLGSIETPEGGLDAQEALALAERHLKVVPQK